MTSPTPPRYPVRSILHRWIEAWGIFLLLGIGIGVVYLWEGQPLRCLSKTLFGLPCPGCGMLRACHALSQGGWAEALYFNPLVYLFIPLLLFRCGQVGYYALRRRPIPQWRLPRWAILLLALLVLGNGIRNIWLGI